MLAGTGTGPEKLLWVLICVVNKVNMRRMFLGLCGSPSFAIIRPRPNPEKQAMLVIAIKD